MRIFTGLMVSRRGAKSFPNHWRAQAENGGGSLRVVARFRPSNADEFGSEKCVKKLSEVRSEGRSFHFPFRTDPHAFRRLRWRLMKAGHLSNSTWIASLSRHVALSGCLSFLDLRIPSLSLGFARGDLQRHRRSNRRRRAAGLQWHNLRLRPGAVGCLSLSACC